MFQRLSLIDYIDDYMGVGVTDVTTKLLQYLVNLMCHLGLTINEKKLVCPRTQVVCLWVFIDTGSISIPERNKKVCAQKGSYSPFSDYCVKLACVF